MVYGYTIQNDVRFPVLALAGYFKAERLVGEGCEDLSRREGANGLFFTHSDHLGSSSWTTDADGRAVQHMEYLPFGEELLNQRATSYSERYTFTGKELDAESNLYYYDARYNSSTYSQFNSIDPMSDKYPSVNPYLYCAGNPIKYVDPTGMVYFYFNTDGEYIGKKFDNEWHNKKYGIKGKLVDRSGKVIQIFDFADPENDAQELRDDGKNRRLQIVKESDIKDMLRSAGAFEYANSTKGLPVYNRYKYILKEGRGNHKLDFSHSDKGMTNRYAPFTYKSFYLVDGIAFNVYDFGNFLFGAAGTSLGYSKIELLAGAHFNSLFNSSTNGYEPQWDSKDDQLSIKLGIEHAIRHNYHPSRPIRK